MTVKQSTKTKTNGVQRVVKARTNGVRGDQREDCTIVVGLGEMAVTRQSDCVLVAYGLGSCVGVAVYDPVASVAGLLHAVLPRHRNGDNNLTKFVDTGIPALVEAMERQGANARRMRWYLAGGAQMLKAPGFKGMFNIGRQNVEMAQQVLAQYGVRPAGVSVEGNVGRTLKLYAADGRVTVRFAGGEEQEL